MIELVLGVGLGLLLGSRAGWPVEAGVVAGIPIGVVLYFLSCAIWAVVPCWNPRCSKKQPMRKGPGKARRRRRPCRVCGGGDNKRIGARLMGRE